MEKSGPPCKKCGGPNTEFVKEWPVALRVQKAGPKGTGRVGDPNRSINATIKLYRCSDCLKTFRVGATQI